MRDILKISPQQRGILKPQFSELSVNNSSILKYPNGKKFAVCLVHDVDVIYPSLSDIFYSSFRYMKKGSINDGFKMFFSRFSKKLNPFFNFEKVIELERKYGATSGFYFTVLNKGEKGYNYNISDLACELKNIRENGWEIGFLGSQNPLCDLKDIVSRKMKLEDVLRDKVVGYGSPYYYFSTPETWKLLDLAGFEYAIAFVDPGSHLGGSRCSPFRAHDIEKKEIYIIVLPLNILDCNIPGSFTNANSSDIDIENSWAYIKQLIDQMSECSGVLTLHFSSIVMMGEGLEFYERILSYCSKKNSWMTSGKEVMEWWVSFHT